MLANLRTTIGIPPRPMLSFQHRVLLATRPVKPELLAQLRRIKRCWPRAGRDGGASGLRGVAALSDSVDVNSATRGVQHTCSLPGLIAARFRLLSADSGCAFPK